MNIDCVQLCFLGSLGPIGSVVNVDIKLDISWMYGVNMVTNKFSMELIYYEKWVDERLRWNSSIGENIIQLKSEDIWTPPFMFLGLTHFHDNMVNIFPNGTIIRNGFKCQKLNTWNAKWLELISQKIGCNYYLLNTA